MKINPLNLKLPSFFRQNAGKGDWAIIELQGDLEVRANQDMHDQFIGDLSYNKYGQPVGLILNQ